MNDDYAEAYVEGALARSTSAEQLPDLDDVARRFHERIDIDANGCWNWTGGKRHKGYGRFYVGDGEYATAHRWSYEHHVGPIPDDLTLDHLCRNTSCVNPEHLEPVTNVENVMRGDCPPAVNARKTNCKRGHELTDENTYRNRGGRGRQCRTCAIANARAHRERKAVQR